MLKTQILKIARDKGVDNRISKEDLEDVNYYLGTELQLLQSDLDQPENQARVANILDGIAQEVELWR